MKIIYRISDNGYPKEKPEYINNENCLNNALRVFKDEDWLIIADGYSGKLPDVEIMEVSVGHGAGTFNLALDQALTYDDDEIVYFLEDDYLHLPDAQKIIKEGFELGYPFVTVYDHPSLYRDSEETRIFITKSCHWKLAPSTTMTFAAEVGSLKKYELPMRINTARKHPKDKAMFQAMSTNGPVLVTSIPGYATHGETAYLSPLTDWSKV
jgi:hypothetical protein